MGTILANKRDTIPVDIWIKLTNTIDLDSALANYVDTSYVTATISDSADVLRIELADTDVDSLSFSDPWLYIYEDGLRDSVDLSALTGSNDNIYNIDGTLTGNRTVTMGSNFIKFSGDKDIFINNNGGIGYGSNPGGNNELLIRNEGETNSIEMGAIESNQNTFIDLTSDTFYTDYGLRLIRNSGGQNGTSSISHRGTGYLDLIVVDAGQMRFKTSNATRMQIDASGNVGIGTTSPASKLDLLGRQIIRRADDVTDRSDIRFMNNSAISPSNPQFNIGLSDPNVFDFHIATWDGTATTRVFEIEADKDINLGEGILFIDYSAENVGIGTTSPGELVHVSGGKLLFDNTYGIRVKDFAGTARDIFWVNTSDNTAIKSAGNNIKFFAADNSTIMTMQESGNVGIGTASPLAKLHVYDGRAIIDHEDTGTALQVTGGNGGAYLGSFARDVGSDGKVLIYSSGGDPGIEFDVEGGGTKWHIGVDDTSDDLKIGNAYPSGGSTHMTIQDDGKVGIGTTSPDAKLDIAITGSATPGTNMALKFSEGADADLFGFRTSADNNFLHLDRVYSSVWSDVMSIQRSTGNVGIGTTSPVSRLEVSDGTLVTTLTSTTHVADNTLAFNYDVAGRAEGSAWELKTDIVNGGATGADYEVGDFEIWGRASVTDSTLQERFKIQANGNVGIGTTNPQASLDISGLHPEIYLSDSDNSTTFDIEQTGAYTLMYNFVPTGAAFIRLDPVPQDGTSNAELQFFRSTNTSGVAQAKFFKGNNTGTVNNVISNGNNYFNDDAGNFGIGTSLPAETLHVMESDASAASTGASVAQFERAGNASITVSTANTGDASILFGDPESASPGRVNYDHALDALSLWTANTQKVTIDTDGNVGIGTTLPAYMLDVFGTGPPFRIIGDGASTMINNSSVSGVNVQPILSLYRRYSGGNGANNIGGRIQFLVEDAAGADQSAALIDVALTDATGGASDSEIRFYTYDADVNRLGQRIRSDGQIRFDQYTTDAFTGTAVNSLAVDANGYVIQEPLGGNSITLAKASFTVDLNAAGLEVRDYTSQTSTSTDLVWETTNRLKCAVSGDIHLVFKAELTPTATRDADMDIYKNGTTSVSGSYHIASNVPNAQGAALTTTIVDACAANDYYQFRTGFSGGTDNDSQFMTATAIFYPD